tara:strand:- start:147 stop:428 length:282 start_codon:yes stop_codon:yes gene_type:complete
MFNKFLIAFSFLVSTAAYPCNSNLDCGMGAKCIKSGYEMYGVCVGGFNSGAPSDSGPKPNGDTAGKSCSYDIDCSSGGKCLKVGFALTGTCSK